jgi:hypothetical protein
MTSHESKKTTDHDEIKKWVEERNGHPSVVKSTHNEEGSGLLRIDFNKPEKNLEEIDWDEFFEIFDSNNLAFLYQDKKTDGETSTFFKFVVKE